MSRPRPRTHHGDGAVSWRHHPYLRHLRLPFNALLTPVYLFGLISASAAVGTGMDVGALLLRAAAAWLSLHVFLYGGATAFNSFYDRDEGPVGGMLEPPPVDRGLLPFSLAAQGLGLPIAVAVSLRFAVAWCLLSAVFVAYSHPAVRLKARPGPALAAIGLGQGSLGFALGWLVVAPAGSLASATAALGMVATAFLITGLYLVTQSYQTGEDRLRGDRTLPVLIGSRGALRLAVALMAPGGALLVLQLHAWAGPAVSVPLLLFFTATGLYLLRWSSRIDEADVHGNYRRAMRVTTAASVSLSLALTASGVTWHV